MLEFPEVYLGELLASGQINMHDTTGGVDLSLEGADLNLSKALDDSMTFLHMRTLT